MAAVRSCKLLSRRCEAITSEVEMASTSPEVEEQTCKEPSSELLFVLVASAS